MGEIKKGTVVRIKGRSGTLTVHHIIDEEKVECVFNKVRLDSGIQYVEDALNYIIVMRDTLEIVL